MEEERRRDREVLKTKDMEAEGNGDREIKDVIAVQKIKGVRFIVRVRWMEGDQNQTKTIYGTGLSQI